MNNGNALVDVSDSEGHIETTSNQNNFAFVWFRYGREKRSPYSTTEHKR